MRPAPAAICSYEAWADVPVACLDEPDDIVGVELILAYPGSQDVPLHALAAINGDAILGMLILGCSQVDQYLPGQLGKEPAMQ